MIDAKNELVKARRGHFAIGAFNTNNLEVTKAICQAAGEFKDFPIIVQTTPSAIEYAGLENIFDIVRNEIENSKIKAVIHLDHAKDFKIIQEAIKIGYKSVMFDGSKYSFDENMAMTEKVVNFAHKHGVCVEAEVGVIGREEGGRVSGHSIMSAPNQVKKFVELTGIDSVAVSVGNEHGAPKGESVNLKLLKQIAEVVDIPLVMHGASGLSRGDILEAMSLGVAKFNIDTNIKRTFAKAIEKSEADDYRDALKEGMGEVKKVVRGYIELFSGKIYEV
jgi:ketose-bisphosphate aldolase